jgi:cytochrome c-type biogenesis protein CcmH
VTAFLTLCALFLAAAVALIAWPLAGQRRGGADAVRSPLAAGIVAGLLPVAAFIIYFSSSNWNWNAPAQAPPDAANHDLRAAVGQLQQKLAQQPDDVEGWKMLGRSATVVGDYPLARTAFKEAYTRTGGSDPDAIAGYAESMVLIDDSAIDGEAADLFEKALAIAPDNTRALWYGGIVAYRRGDMALAQRRWVELQEHDLPPDLRQVLAERLAELEQAVGKPATKVAAPAAGGAAAAGIELSIALAPALAAKVPPGATLFVIARRGTGGPPLAVQRRPVGAWPVALSLSDADAMMPGTKLADGGPLKLVARISGSGQPIAAAGDLFGEVGYDFSSAHPATITIDRIVP